MPGFLLKVGKKIVKHEQKKLQERYSGRSGSSGGSSAQAALESAPDVVTKQFPKRSSKNNGSKY